MTKLNLILEAFSRGYRVVNGQVFFKDKRLKGSKSKDGYLDFSIRICGGGTRKVKAHRLLAYQKYAAAMFEDGIEVRHLDGDKNNNLDYNIAIGTHSQNMMDKSPETRRAAAIKASQAMAKFDHSKIISFHQNTKSYKKTMAEFGISSKGTLNFILRKSMAQKII